MIDLHVHILPGIDDGPRTSDAAVALARAAVDAGTSTIVATPHVSWAYPTDAGAIDRVADDLRVRLRETGTPAELICGAEIAMTRVGSIGAHELGRLAIGRGPWLLMETPFTPSWGDLAGVVERLQLAGHRVLLAHPERCLAFRRDPAALEELVGTGVLTSITAGSLVGAFGEEVRMFALALVRGGLAHNVASDAHDLVRRPPRVLENLRAAGLEPLANWLTVAVPRAILSGDEIPPRPSVQLAGVDDNRAAWRRGTQRFRRAS